MGTLSQKNAKNNCQKKKKKKKKIYIRVILPLLLLHGQPLLQQPWLSAAVVEGAHPSCSCNDQDS